MCLGMPILSHREKWIQKKSAVSEILNQILAVRETLTDETSITNVVLMGMGEPLANYENTLKAIELMVHPDAFKFSSRRVTSVHSRSSP